jgi:hypothetical protein
MVWVHACVLFTGKVAPFGNIHDEEGRGRITNVHDVRPWVLPPHGAWEERSGKSREREGAEKRGKKRQTLKQRRAYSVA